LDAGPSGDITMKGSVTGGGAFIVRDGKAQSYQRLELGSIEIQDATTSVAFSGEVSTTGNINVISGDLIVQDAPVKTALNLTYTASRINLGADITTTKNQVYNGPISFTSNATLRGDVIRFNGGFTTNGNSISFISNEPVLFPPFNNYAEMTSTLLQFNPGVELVANLEGAGLLLSYYISEYQQSQLERESGDVFFGDGNVLRIGPDVTCSDEVCEPLVSIDNLISNPDTFAVQPATIGDLSRTLGPAVLPIF
jgi:hypothetical protein